MVKETWIVKIIAKNPPSILLVFGAAGLLAGLSGASTLLWCGVALQIGWLFFNNAHKFR